MSDIYRYAWTGKSTGNTYQIDICSAGATLPVTPVVTTLADDVILSLDDFSWEYDRYPVGFHAPLKCDVVFALSKMPQELLEWLTIDRTTVNIVLNDDMANPSDKVTIAVSQGCAMMLSVNGVARWHAMQNVTSQIAIGTDDKLKCNFQDAFAVAAKALLMEKVQEADWNFVKANHATEVVAKVGVIDWLWQAGSHWSAIAGYAGGYVWAVKRSTLYTRWELHVQQALQALSRRALSFSCDSQLRLDLRYGLRIQRYSKTETYPGAALTIANEYVIPFIASKSDSSGTQVYSMHQDLSKNASTLYDLLAGLFGETTRTTAISYSGLNCLPLVVDALDSTAVYNIDDNNKVTDVVLNNTIIGKATASTEFVIADDVGSYTNTLQGSINEAEQVANILTTQLPIACKERAAYYFGSAFVEANGTLAANTVIADGAVRFNSCYYLANPSSVYTEAQLIRCHSWLPMPSDATPPSSASFALNSSADHLAIAYADANEWGALRDTSDYLAATFGRLYAANPLPTTCTIEMQLQIDIATVPNSYAIGLDMTGLGGLYAYTPTTWWIIGCQIDLLNETMKVNCYGK